MRKKINPMLLADFYKESHAELYDKDTEVVYATWTPRRSLIEGVNEVVVFGIQGFVQKYLIDYFNENFFDLPREEVLDSYLRMMRNTLGNDGLGMERISALHDLGYLPIQIDALKEGTLCPIRVPMMTIVNTLPEFYWITNFLETLLSTEIWKPMTSATLAYQFRKKLDIWADKTCDNRDHIKYQCHDFSMRGIAGVDAVMTSGAGHLLSFSGTDSIPAIYFAEEYYGANVEDEDWTAPPATEHSIMCANSAFEKDGDKLKELEAFRRIVKDIHPSGFVSIVSDTWNLWDVCTEILPALKEDILARDGRVVIRPDSGNPVDIICGAENVFGNETYGECKTKGVIELLWDTFGGTTNSKGYKVLDSHIGAIYGDAITLDRAEQICTRLEAKGFASSNIVFGIGSFTYQYNTRDTFGFALKSTYAEKGGRSVLLFKDPITDDGTKKSQKGMVFVGQETDGTIFFEDEYYRADKQLYAKHDLLKPIFKDGRMLIETTFAEVRDKLASYTAIKESINIS